MAEPKKTEGLPSPFESLPAEAGVPEPPSPPPMPLQTKVYNTMLDGQAVDLYRFRSKPVAEAAEPEQPRKEFRLTGRMAMPDVIEPAMEWRLSKAFPELSWRDEAENWGKIRIEGSTREKPAHAMISITRKESPGPFELAIRLSARDGAEAEKSAKETVERIRLALLGWSEFHVPQFKKRLSATLNGDQEEMVDLPFALESGWTRLFDEKTDITISTLLLRALERHGQVMEARAKLPEKYPGYDTPKNWAAGVRGAAARVILTRAVACGPGESLEVEIEQVREAHSLVGELLENGLGRVVLYGYQRGRRGLPVSVRRMRVHCSRGAREGSGFIAYSAALGEASAFGEFLRAAV